VLATGRIFTITDSGTTKERSAEITAISKSIAGWGSKIKGYSFKIVTPAESVKHKTETFSTYEIISSKDKVSFKSELHSKVDVGAASTTQK
jgi:hypothetical protein